MTGEIAVFEKEEFGKVRGVLINNEPYFVGKDVASVLGYKDTADAIKLHVDEEDRMGGQNTDLYIIDSMGRKQFPIFINESGIYALIFGSKLESAKKIKRWVTSEVLPAIRKTGRYEVTKTDKVGTELRKKSKEIRHKFTDTLKEHGYSKQHEYIQTTQQMKKNLGISKKKDEMSEKELLAISASELLTEFLLTDEQGFSEVNPVCIDATDEVKKLADKRDLLKITA